VLAAAQALAGGNTTVIVATGGIVGTMLAPNATLATVPISLMAVGMWIGTLPVGILAKAFGRRFALQTGTTFGALSGLISCTAVLSGSFVLFLAGTLCGGLYAAAHQSYRFAAADTATPQFRPRAIAWVLAGGVFAGVIGPQLVILTKDEQGTVEAVELGDVAELGELQAIEAELAELLAEEDIEHLAAAMEPNSTAGVLIWENLWAAPFASAARRSGGQLIANGRIPIQAIIASIEADQASATEGD